MGRSVKRIVGRLEEMPAEEGFPAYLASRLSAFYERAGMMHNLNGTDCSVTIIGAVSPQGEISQSQLHRIPNDLSVASGDLINPWLTQDIFQRFTG